MKSFFLRYESIPSLLSNLNKTNLQVFSKANDPIRFLEAQRHVKTETVHVVKPAIAGKFGAASFSCPFFTLGKQLSGIAFPAILFRHKDALEISDRRALCSFNRVVAQLSLCKRVRLTADSFEKADSFLICHQSANLLCQILNIMICPHLNCQTSKLFGIFYSCSFNHRLIFFS